MREIQSDFKIQFQERRRSLNEVYSGAGKGRDASLTHLADARNMLNRLQKRLSKGGVPDSEVAQIVLEVARRIGALKRSFDEQAENLELQRKQESTPVEIVEKLFDELKRVTTIWAEEAQSFEEIYSELENADLPGEVTEIEEELMQKGFEIVLASAHGDSSSEAVAGWHREIAKLLGRAEPAQTDRDVA